MQHLRSSFYSRLLTIYNFVKIFVRLLHGLIYFSLCRRCKSLPRRCSWTFVTQSFLPIRSGGGGEWLCDECRRTSAWEATDAIKPWLVTSARQSWDLLDPPRIQSITRNAFQISFHPDLKKQQWLFNKSWISAYYWHTEKGPEQGFCLLLFLNTHQFWIDQIDQYDCWNLQNSLCVHIDLEISKFKFTREVPPLATLIINIWSLLNSHDTWNRILILA